MKISDYKGDAAYQLLIDIIEPCTEIMADADVAAAFKGGKAGMPLVKVILKNHKDAVIAILAAVKGVTPEAYMAECNVLTIPFDCLKLINDKELMSTFSSAEMSRDE